MLRISIENGSDEGIRLRVEGRLVGPWVQELRQQSEQALLKSKNVTLDLEKLLFVDGAGVALLQELAERAVAHVNCSIFISEQLRRPPYDER